MKTQENVPGGGVMNETRRSVWSDAGVKSEADEERHSRPTCRAVQVRICMLRCPAKPRLRGFYGRRHADAAVNEALAKMPWRKAEKAAVQ